LGGRSLLITTHERSRKNQWWPEVQGEVKGVRLFADLTGNSLEQFTTGAQPVILWPAKYKTGDALYPYDDKARK
jgi:hypothetical protein